MKVLTLLFAILLAACGKEVLPTKVCSGTVDGVAYTYRFETMGEGASYHVSCTADDGTYSYDGGRSYQHLDTFYDLQGYCLFYHSKADKSAPLNPGTMLDVNPNISEVRVKDRTGGYRGTQLGSFSCSEEK